MRIAIDGTLLHGQYSGVEYAIHHLLRELAATDSENEYIVYVPAGFTSERDSPPNFSWRRISFQGSRRLRRILWQQCQLPGRLRKDGVAIFHGPGYVIPVRCAVPSVVTVYDIIALTHPELCRLSNRLHYGIVLPNSLRTATRVVVPSHSVRNEILHRFPDIEDKIRVVPLGINPVFFSQPSPTEREQVKVKYNLPDHLLLFIGNLEAKKNLRQLIGIFHGLRVQQGLPHHLILTGSKQQAHVEELTALVADLKLDAYVHLLGYLPETDLRCLYALADVFVFPSLIEGFGLPVLEAMALGAPVVASDRGALPEVVGDAGILVDPEAADEVASALHRVLTDSQLRLDLIRKGRQRARQYSWQNTARQVIEVYEEVAG
jgi:glycosyltransferase involved in cell wall biosynthesis